MLNKPDPLTPPGHVIVIDDDASVRRSLRAILERVGYEVRLYEGATAFLESNTPTPVPAVMLLDMRMPGMTGVGLQAQIQGDLQHTPIVFMSGDSRPDEIITAMKQGAFDFLLKPFTAQALLTVIEKAMEHSRRSQLQQHQKKHTTDRLQRLTPRELAVCQWMVRGYTNKQIASFDGAAPATIKLHRAHVMEKMGVRTLPELMEAIGDFFDSA